MCDKSGAGASILRRLLGLGQIIHRASCRLGHNSIYFLHETGGLSVIFSFMSKGKADRSSRSEHGFITTVIVAGVLLGSFLLINTHKLWNDEYMVQIEFEGRQSNYHFPPGNQGLNRYRASAKCVGEESVDIYLYKSERRIRFLSYCPSQVKASDIRQDFTPPKE